MRRASRVTHPAIAAHRGPRGGTEKGRDMGNRAVITTEKRDLGVYLHWNGGENSVAAFLQYCKLRGFRSPEEDEYGWARLCQIAANFFGPSGLHIGISRYTDDERENPGDNGIYVIRDWDVVQRIYGAYALGDASPQETLAMLIEIDDCQPEGQRLGDFLISPEVPVGEVSVGDLAYIRLASGVFEAIRVEGFGSAGKIVNGTCVDGLPYVALYGDDYAENVNNYILTETVRIKR